MSQYHLFDTALGIASISWNTADEIDGVLLPEPNVADLRDWLGVLGATEGQPPTIVIDAAQRIVALLCGDNPDFADLPLFTSELPEFDQRVYALTSAIPRGRTRTYGQLATDLGMPGAAQAVGQALGRNPIPAIIPCHRVLGAGKEVGGFSAPGGATTKSKILAIEGVSGFDEPTLF